MSILAPSFLVNRIDLIALILGAVILVVFTDFINSYVVFPIADKVKYKARHKIREIGESRIVYNLSKYASEGLATIIFLLYCYLGASVLAEYVFAPIMFKMKNFILIVVIVLFFLISYFINNKEFRDMFMSFKKF